jgi:hypothetical protein
MLIVSANKKTPVGAFTRLSNEVFDSRYPDELEIIDNFVNLIVLMITVFPRAVYGL